MHYTVTTFKVRLEVSDVGDRTAASDDVNRVARSIFANLDADKEHFVLLALNNRNRVNGFKVISTGTLTASLIRPGDFYRAALLWPQQQLSSFTIIHPKIRCRVKKTMRSRAGSRNVARCSRFECSIM